MRGNRGAICLAVALRGFCSYQHHVNNTDQLQQSASIMKISYSNMLLIGLSVLLAFFTGCSSLKRLTILVDMDADQEQYLKNSILQSYEKKTAIKVKVIEYHDADSLELLMKKYAGQLNLVQLPLDKSQSLAKRGYFKPLDSFLTSEELRFFNDNFLLGSFGMVASRPTLIPRSFETSVLAYSKSRLNEALKLWPEKKELIAQILKKYNGVGLPDGYVLESDPNQWDYYDIVVIGLVWAKNELNGVADGRMAHKARKNAELSAFIEGGISQCGGDSLSIMRCSGDAVVDFLEWEALWSNTGVYNKKMWDSGWGSAELLDYFASGEVYMAIMTQAEAFRLHGTGHAERKGMMKDPSDLGLALLPSGCSVELNAKGKVVRKGNRAVQTKNTWWGIPFDASSSLLSYRLAHFISDTAIHAAECSRFGLIPVRKEVVDGLGTLFEDPWTSAALGTSLEQLIQNGNISVSGRLATGKLGTLYIDLWYDCIVGQNWAERAGAIPDRSYLKKLLETKAASRAAVP